MIIYLIPALNLRLNKGLGLKTHAVRALRDYVRSFCSSSLFPPQPSQLLTVQDSTASLCQALRASPGSWRFGAAAQGQPGAGAAGGCPWLLLTMGRGSWAALMSCGDVLPALWGSPSSSWHPAPRQPSLHPGSWRREGWGAPDDPVCTTQKSGARGTKLQSRNAAMRCR